MHTVSVVIPTLGDPLLADALDSVAAQTHEHTEVVLVDGSDGGIEESLRERADVYAYQEPAGLSAARNYGIDLASGEFVAFLDEDDLLTTDSLASRARALADGCDVVYGDWYEVDADFSLDRYGSPTRHAAPPTRNDGRQHVRQFAEQGLRPSAVMVRARCLERHRFDPARRMAEDFHLWVRLAHDFRVRALGVPVCYYRVREGSLSRADRDWYRREKLAAIDDLVDRYPDLETHADRVRGREWYLHGREKLAAGESRPALAAAAKSLVADPRPRSAALFLVGCLPVSAASKNGLFGRLEQLADAIESR